MIKLCVALPHQNYYSVGITQFVYELKDKCKELGFDTPVVIMRGDRPVDFCRNLMANDFMEISKCDWMLSIDDDMMPDCKEVLEMVRRADEAGHKLVSAHCNGTLRGVPVSVAFNRSGGTDQVPVWGRLEIENTQKNGYIPVDAFGTGCYAVHRDVFEQLEKPWYSFRYANGGLIRTYGEDIDFTYRAKQAGFQPQYDTDVFVPHLKEVKL